MFVNRLSVRFRHLRLILINIRYDTLCFILLFSLRLISVQLFSDRRLFISLHYNTLISVHIDRHGVSLGRRVFVRLCRRGVLIGTVLSSFFSSIQTTLTRVMDPNEYDNLLATLVASFSNINSEIIVFSIVILALVIFVLRKDLALLNVITLGKEQAINLGVDYDRSIRRLLLGVTLCIAVATAMVGPISFLGLIIANLSRQLLKTFRHSFLIIGSALFGMIILVGGQMIVEHVFTYTIPVSVFITVGGGVYFLYLLLTNRRA